MAAGSFIDNEWIDGNGEPFESISPSSEKSIWQGNGASDIDTQLAFDAARKAFHQWSQRSLENRMEIARRFAELVNESKVEFAKVISEEMGKPLWEAKTEVAAVAGKVELAIDALLTRRHQTSFSMGKMNAVTRFKPHGVLAVLGPFNLPAHLPNGHIVPAILPGNTIVFKPSEMTPKVGETMMRIWENAGLPPGVINMVQGGRETGVAISKSSELDGLLFTGSSRAGVAINKSLADQPQKIVALEMGGNNALIMHQCKNLEAAAYETVLSAFITSGQRCTCARRLILVKGHESEQFINELVRMIANIRVGFFDDEIEPFIGPVVNRESGTRLINAQSQLVDDGAELIVPMESQRNNPALLTPGLLDVTNASNLEDEELFGPLLQVKIVDTFEHAIEEANNSRYGLSAGLISDQRSLFNQFISQIRAGVVNWNRQTTGASGKLPFGGCGLSGNHRPSGFYAADYCSYPVASLESEQVTLPEEPAIGITFA